MQQDAINQLLEQLPDQPNVFIGSEYPNPIQSTFLGEQFIDINVLRNTLLQKQSGPLIDLLEPILLAAEVIESCQEDRERFFITDENAQGLVFTGSKWKAGWVLVLGGEDQDELVAELHRYDFIVFTDHANIPDTIYIGDRPTSPVYFLQLMVRYGLIWGKIAPGDDHEMGHFLEKDMPGLIIIKNDLPALKYLITLGLMKLGAPAVVPSTFPFPYGYRAVGDNVAEILDRISGMPNLRQRFFEDEILKLPAPCDLAWINEKIDVGQYFGGGPDSFFCVQPSDQVGERTRIIGQPVNQMAIRVRISADHFTDDIASSVEKTALRSLNTIPGLRAWLKDEIFFMEIGKGVQIDWLLLGEAIYYGIRLVYPRLKEIGTEVIFDPQVLAGLSGEFKDYKISRKKFIKGMTEANTSEFCACIECRPFSLVHTCILTPEHSPMCGSRTYGSVRAGAYFGSDQVPWKRPTDKELPMRIVFEKGQLLDPEVGEYEGCNQVYREMTRGQLQRVFLHSVRNYPLTSCGCFQALAFWIPEVEGIGILSRNSSILTPAGQNWAELANHAGGKQTPGIVGVSYQYMHSQKFLKGDGGMANVVWADSILQKKISKLFTPGQIVASEESVHTIAELKSFLGDRTQFGVVTK